MVKLYFTILISFYIIVFNSYAKADDWNQQLYDSIYFAENGNGIVVDIEKIKLSLSNGASPNWINSKNKQEKSVIAHYVEDICLFDNPEIISKGIEALQLLFQNKAKLQYSDGAILFWPIAREKYDIVKLLLENGANPTFWPKDELGDGYEFTPIEEATASGYGKIVSLLESYGAKKPSEKEAAQLRFVEAASSGTINELKELLKKGARINEKNRNGETALINALSNILFKYNTYIRVLYLLDEGADVNLKGRRLGDPTLPLHQAIYRSSFLFNAKNQDTSYAEQILQALIKKGAFVSGIDENDRTPLHIAAKYNNLYAAQLLLKSDAKIMPKDKIGKTPLDYAESAEMIKLLRSHGATEN